MDYFEYKYLGKKPSNENERKEFEEMKNMKSKINLKIFSVKLRNALLASKYVKYPNQLTLVGLLKRIVTD